MRRAVAPSATASRHGLDVATSTNTIVPRQGVMMMANSGLAFVRAVVRCASCFYQEFSLRSDSSSGCIQDKKSCHDHSTDVVAMQHTQSWNLSWREVPMKMTGGLRSLSRLKQQQRLYSCSVQKSIVNKKANQWGRVFCPWVLKFEYLSTTMNGFS